MTRQTFAFAVAALCVLVAAPAAAQPAPSRAALRVVSAGPAGDLQPEQDTEVRVVFSEPMVAIGRVPTRLKPAFQVSSLGETAALAEQKAARDERYKARKAAKKQRRKG